MNDLYDVYSIGITTALISFLGFLLENIWLAFTKGYMDNRNMKFPFLFGYGLLVMAMHMFLGTPSAFAARICTSLDAPEFVGKIIYFLTVMVIVSAGEILLGTFMEKTCHIEYWNYSWIPMHLTKYTSLPTSIGFALVISVFEEYFACPLINAAARLPIAFRMPAATVLVGIMTADMICSFFAMKRAKGFNERWRIQFNDKRLVMQKR